MHSPLLFDYNFRCCCFAPFQHCCALLSALTCFQCQHTIAHVLVILTQTMNFSLVMQ